MMTAPFGRRPTPCDKMLAVFGSRRFGGVLMWTATNGESALKAADVLIAWTPAPCARVHLTPGAYSTMGDVAVLAWPDVSGLASAYARTLGANDPSWRAATGEGLAARLSIAFNTLVMRFLEST